MTAVGMTRRATAIKAIQDKAAADDGTLSTDWEVNDTYNVETRTTDAQCRTCGVIVADVDASAIVVTL